jgi:hypothetical protein
VVRETEIATNSSMAVPDFVGSVTEVAVIVIASSLDGGLAPGRQQHAVHLR